MRLDRAIVDAGPLVALLSQSDAAHLACTEVAQELLPPMLSTWAVLAEAAWLLRNTQQGLTNLLRLVTEGIVVCPSLDSAAAAWIRDRAKQYQDLRPQLADLTLLYLVGAREDHNDFHFGSAGLHGIPRFTGECL